MSFHYADDDNWYDGISTKKKFEKSLQDHSSEEIKNLWKLVKNFPRTHLEKKFMITTELLHQMAFTLVSPERGYPHEVWEHKCGYTVHFTEKELWSDKNKSLNSEDLSVFFSKFLKCYEISLLTKFWDRLYA